MLAFFDARFYCLMPFIFFDYFAFVAPPHAPLMFFAPFARLCAMLLDADMLPSSLRRDAMLLRYDDDMPLFIISPLFRSPLSPYYALFFFAIIDGGRRRHATMPGVYAMPPRRCRAARRAAYYASAPITVTTCCCQHFMTPIPPCCRYGCCRTPAATPLLCR